MSTPSTEPLARPEAPPNTPRIVQRQRKLKGAGGGAEVRDGVGGIVKLDQ